MTEMQFLFMVLGLLAVAVTLVVPEPNIWQLLWQRIALGAMELFYSDFSLQGLERALDGDYSATRAYHEARKVQVRKEEFDKLYEKLPNNHFTNGMGDLVGRRKLSEMGRLVHRFSEQDVPLSPEVKVQLASFKTLYEQYADLLKRLNAVQKALMNNKYELIEDELVVCSDVKYPILLVKQYSIEEGIWHAIPAASYIADRDSIREWISLHETHPQTRDRLFSPSLHVIKNTSDGALHTMPTRYVWHELTNTQCLAQELLEGTAALRAQYKKMSCILADIDEGRLTASSSCPQSLFPDRTSRPESDSLEPNLEPPRTIRMN